MTFTPAVYLKPALVQAQGQEVCHHCHRQDDSNRHLFHAFNRSGLESQRPLCSFQMLVNILLLRKSASETPPTVRCSVPSPQIKFYYKYRRSSAPLLFLFALTPRGKMEINMADIEEIYF